MRLARRMLSALAPPRTSWPAARRDTHYRGEAFSRVKPKNGDALQKAQAEGRLRVLLSSTVTDIEAAQVTLEQGGKRLRLPNDAVIVCAGGVLPTPLLKEIGVQVETKFGSA